MAGEIIVALLGFAGTAIGSTVGALTSAKLTNYRLEQLELAVSKYHHNNERLALLEQKGEQYEKRISRLEEKIEKD